MKSLLLMFSLLLCSFLSKAQEKFNLYKITPEKVDASISNESVNDKGHLQNVTNPELFVYKSAQANSSAVIICPGGGYRIEAVNHEGHEFAKHFQKHGITAIVLKYRLPFGHSSVPMSDAQHAIRWARLHAEAQNIDPTKVGIMGFSAGGHLASTVSTHYDKGDKTKGNDIAAYSCRPDFSVLIYPVISMLDEVTHKGSRRNLLGDNPTEEEMYYFSNDLQITNDTPPAFILHADDDKAVPSTNSLRYYSALKEHGVKGELHIFNKGGHGFGMGRDNSPVCGWINKLYEWMKTEHIL